MKLYSPRVAYQLFVTAGGGLLILWAWFRTWCLPLILEEGEAPNEEKLAAIFAITIGAIISVIGFTCTSTRSHRLTPIYFRRQFMRA
jgi:hypothetical protein